MKENYFVHFVGIGGSGLSAIARVLIESGQMVSGSDRQDSPLLRSLAAAGARVYVGHQVENVQGAGLVIRSSAVAEDNPEVRAAIAAGIPVLKRSEYLGQLLAGRSSIAVAGTHGKTTTTAMIAWMLSELKQDPGFIVGGIIQGLKTNARAGRGKVFVIEADEYDGMFLGLHPWIAVVTNLEHDHPDCYPTPEDYRQAFLGFVNQIEPGGLLLACADDSGAQQLSGAASALGVKVLDYGLSPGAAYQAVDLSVNERGGFRFRLTLTDILAGSESPVEVDLQVPGQHNVRNCLAALAVAHQMGLSLQVAATSLAHFAGTGRRFEVIGEQAGVTVINDYAHHPSEIRATLSAARSRYPGRKLWAVWQPHTYSRTRQLLADFSGAFHNADSVVVTEIFAARESFPADGFSGRQAAQAIQHAEVHFSPQFAQTSALLLDRMQPGDILLVLSAGDADQISAQVLEALSKRSNTDA